MAANWELALIAVVERQLAQLEWLIKCELSGEEGIEKGDIHAQVSRLGGLTELAMADGLPLSETTTAKLHQQNDLAMHLVRTQVFGREKPCQPPERSQSPRLHAGEGTRPMSRDNPMSSEHALVATGYGAGRTPELASIPPQAKTWCTTP